MASLVVLLAIVGIANASVIKTPEVHLSMSEEELMHYFGVRSVDQVPEYHITDLEIATDDGIKVDRAEREWPTTDGVIIERAEPELVTDGGDPFDRMGQREAVTDGGDPFDRMGQREAEWPTTDGYNIVERAVEPEWATTDGYAYKRSTEDHSEIQIQMEAFGEPLQMELRKTEGLIAPAFVVQEVYAEGPSRVTVRSDHACYHGKVSSRADSRVALCKFDGMRGVIHVNGEELVVQPLRHGYDSHVRRGLSDPHIVYKTTEEAYSPIADGVKSQSERVYRQDQDPTAKKYMELMFVADHTMYDVYGDSTEEYLLATANIVATLFKDPSLGVDLTVQLVKVVILKEDIPELPLSTKAKSLVQVFCNYQKSFNSPDDSDPLHADIAVHLTKMGLDHGGVGDQGGACITGRQCALVKYAGLSSTFVIAHEIGHVMNVGHDGGACQNFVNIMTSVLASGGGMFEWSSCSAQMARDFFSSSQSSCFNDQPISSVVLDTSLNGRKPGMLYDFTKQCQLAWGAGASLCSGGKSCVQLNCASPNGGCNSNKAPPMEGTQCDDRKWCIKGECVDFGNEGPDPINGGWSDYDAEFSACSRTCGGGVQTRKRYCTNPKPQYGGTPCTGEDTIYQMCNVQECSKSPFDYADEQCSEWNTAEKTYYASFGPGLTDNDFCFGWCSADWSREGPKVFRPGTSCNIFGGAYNRGYRTCIDKRCWSFGCDGQPNSNAVFDRCEKCNGNGNTCEEASGTITEGTHNQYVTVLTIPAGSANVEVVETNLYVVIAMKVNGNYLIGGNGLAGSTTTRFENKIVFFAGSYEVENITIPGILPVDVEVQVRQNYPDYYGSQVKPVLNYRYYRPLAIPVTTPTPVTYHWVKSDGVCSTTCGTGTRQPVITCVRDNDSQQVDQSHCDSNTKPSSGAVPCTLQDCPQPRWNSGDWGECSVTCGEGVKTRQVTCRSGEDTSVIVPDGQCQSAKPTTTEKCQASTCIGEGCVYEPDTFRPGYDLNDGRQNKVANREECCQSCQNTDECSAWSFDKDPASADFGSCWLRKPWTTPEHNTKFDSGLVNSEFVEADGCRFQTNVLQFGYGQWGNNGKENVVATREECCQKCRNEPGCKSFAFIKYPGPRFGECWYINVDSVPNDNSCCDGGVLIG